MIPDHVRDQFGRVRVALAAHALQPFADRLHSELRRVARNSDADPTFVGGHIVHAVGCDLAEVLVLEVVHFHAFRITFGVIIGATVLVVADDLFLLGIDRDDRLTFRLRRNDFCVDVSELRVAIGVFGALVGLPIMLAREPRGIG